MRWLLLTLVLLPLGWAQLPHEPAPLAQTAEFHFVRLEYTDRPEIQRGWYRGWWRQDFPEAETHFVQGIRRLTRIDTGEPHHFRLTDPRLYDHPWVYATQTGYWDLSAAERAKLKDYLARGGFLVVDDFHGPVDWAVFSATMQDVLPGRPIVDVPLDDPAMHTLYDVNERIFIPGMRHLRRGAAGVEVYQPPDNPPQWRGIYDERGRLLVAVHYNMDVGDAWEHADDPVYPIDMTMLAYRLGINYLVYAMTH